MAQRLSGEPDNSKFNSERPEKEVTTTTKDEKTMLDVSTGSITSFIDSSNSTIIPLDFDIPFNIGLTVVTATGAKVVVVYE